MSTKFRWKILRVAKQRRSGFFVFQRGITTLKSLHTGNRTRRAEQHAKKNCNRDKVVARRWFQSSPVLTIGILVLGTSFHLRQRALPHYSGCLLISIMKMTLKGIMLLRFPNFLLHGILDLDCRALLPVWRIFSVVIDTPLKSLASFASTRNPSPYCM